MIAWDVEMVRYLVAKATGQRLAHTEFAHVRRVCSNNPVIGTHHDTRLRQAVEKGNEFTQHRISHVNFVTNVSQR